MGRLCYYDEDAGFVPYEDEDEEENMNDNISHGRIIQADFQPSGVETTGGVHESRPSNADKIRSMTDEDLAKWLSCPGRKKDMFPDLEIYIAPSAEEWLDWLKEEAKDG